jgi:Polysaccharide biosynthesis protein
VATVPEIIAAMREAAPAGCQRLDDAVLRELSSLTQALLAASADAAEECERYLAIRRRAIAIPAAELREWLGGACVLVTGGTGCVGSALIRQIAALGPRRLVSLSRGRTGAWSRSPAAEYLQADIRDPAGLRTAVSRVRPDVIFHLAAQRDPGLAEREVHHTVTTNVLGTRNLICVAEELGVRDVVYASSGKALRPYSRSVYTATKRIDEWLIARAARRGGRHSGARFTHVVDNSIVYDRLLGWCDGGVIRLHSPDTMFYAQSALESAQALLYAGVGSAGAGSAAADSARAPGAGGGTLWMHAQTDLGWPVSLLDLALGVVLRTGSDVPIYISGHDPGYEVTPFPGLYDPRTAGEVSPLMSAFEAIRARRGPGQPTDMFPVQTGPADVPERLLAKLERVCRVTAEPAAVLTALDALSWSLFDAALTTVPGDVLARAASLTEPHARQLCPAYRRMLSAIKLHMNVAHPGLG